MEYEPELLKGNIQTIILAILESGDLHGYGVAKEIERRSEDGLAFGEGTIYPALRALERQGFIQGAWNISASGPAKKLYSLTDDGRQELVRRRKTWERFARTINRVIGANPDAQSA